MELFITKQGDVVERIEENLYQRPWGEELKILDSNVVPCTNGQCERYEIVRQENWQTVLDFLGRYNIRYYCRNNEDTYQKLCVRLLKYVYMFDPEKGLLDSYLIGNIRGFIYDDWVRDSRYKHKEVTCDFDDEEVNLIFRIQIGGGNRQSYIEDMRLIAEMEGKEKLWKYLELYYLCNHTIREISKIMGATTKTVVSRLKEAREYFGRVMR